MKQIPMHLLTLVTGLALAGSVAAQTMTRSEYQAEKNKISADYKAAKKACSASKDQARDLCVVQAKSDEKMAKAQLEDRWKPTLKSHYKTQEVKAETDYAIAKVRCNESASKEKDSCIQSAKAAEKTAKNQAKTELKAAEEKAQAQRQANYQAEKEKCEAMSGVNKMECLGKARLKLAE